MRPLVGRLRLDQAIGVMHDVLAGLAPAEKRNIVHRDLKPENLLVTDDGRVKIADFGIAKAVDRVATVEFRTAQGMTVGTPTYMAPEQAMGTELTPATDLYSLGVIAYEMMVGKLPFESESPVALLLHHVSDPPPPPLSINPTLDPRIGAWIERLLVKEMSERTGSAEQAWDELEDIAIGLLGPRWRRYALLPDPRTGDSPPPAPSTPAGSSGYLTVDPDRLGAGQPVSGSTDDQPTAVQRDDTAPAVQRAPTPPPVQRAPTPPPVQPEPAPPPPLADPFRAPPRAVPGPAPLPEPVQTPKPAPVPERVPTPEPAPAIPLGLDATVPPQRPLATPVPQHAEPARGRGIRWVVWLPILLVLAGGAAAAAFMVRPDPGPGPSPEATATAPSDDPGGQGTSTFPTNSFELTLPGEWTAKCLERSDDCSGGQVPSGVRRSAFVSGTGADQSKLSVDRAPLTGAARSLAVSAIAEQAESVLAKGLNGYLRSSDAVRTVTMGDKREAKEFSFTSVNPDFKNGTVVVFKEGSDAYIITGIGPEPAGAKKVAEVAAQSLTPR